MKTLAILAALLCLPLKAAEHTAKIQHKDYDTALEHRDHIHFKMVSTKLGMISTTFTGVVKEFGVAFKSSGNTLYNGSINFKVEQMDTDLGGRNKKMLDLCLQHKKFPEIKVDFSQAKLQLGAAPQLIKGKMTVLGESYPIEATMSATRDKDGITIKGNSAVALSTLKIPDPSIAIASVKDRVDLEFQVTVK